tara:strand:- start:12006 stop:13664 length:1659 start_codon:yes stop_codon:yes gene_type:complete
MNALDAKGTNITVDFSEDMKRVVVCDDGVGFVSLEDVEKLFGTFGFCHETQEELSRGRNYGRFGLGRAQCLAFGSTIWTTNQFTMEVDLKGNSTSDLPYIIKDHGKMLHKGCKIEIDLYELMSLHDKRSLIMSLKNMAKYVNETLTINGSQVNDNVSGVKWDAKDDDFYFLNAPSERGLAIYNKGVLVCTYGHSKFGVSGDIVSHSENFSVNMARNDVLVAECALWKKIPAFLKPFAEKKVKNTLTNQDRTYLIGLMLKGEALYEDVKTKRIFQNSDGKFFTLKQVLNHARGVVAMAPTHWEQHRGTSFHSRKIAFCFSYDFADTHGFKDLQEFFDALKESGMDIHEYPLDLSDVSVMDFKEASETVNDNYDIMPHSDLSKLDKARLKAVSSMYDLLLMSFVRSELQSTPLNRNQGAWEREAATKKKCRRYIHVGKSDVSDAWTDGERYIAININLLRDSFNKGLNGLLNLLTLLVHEQCHEGLSSGSHSHDGEFYERFHDIMTDENTSIFTIAAQGLETYLSENKKMKRMLSVIEVKNTFRTLERLFNKAQ